MKNNQNNKKGAFVISLDFELLWGVIDKHGPKDYGQSNVKSVEIIIPRLMAMFEKYGVKATVGYVGMMLYSGKNDLFRNMPKKMPSYKKISLSPYRKGFIESIQKEDASLYFAPELVEMLRRNPIIELGSHTFCHYYCDEIGQTKEEFEYDIEKAVAQAKEKGIELHSVIFPRNQVRDEYLAVCAKFGFKTYRGNPNHFFSRNRPAILNKIGRLVDAYFPLIKTTYPYEEIVEVGGMINVKASRFFRPYSKRLSCLEWLKVRRIKQEVRWAAKHGEVYHLWWHPHNFGANMEKNLRQLESVLQTFKECKEKSGMEAYTMSGIASLITSKR